MATTKKPAAKRASTKKAPVKKTVASKSTRATTTRRPKAVAAKAPVARKSTAKKTAAKRSTKATSASMRSFHVAQNPTPFTSFKITRQTVYWVILIAFIIFAQLWIIKLQVEVANLIDIQQQEIINNAF